MKQTKDWQDEMDERDRKWDRREFLAQLILALLAFILILRFEFLNEITAEGVSYYEVGVRHPLPPLELK